MQFQIFVLFPLSISVSLFPLTVALQFDESCSVVAMLWENQHAWLVVYISWKQVKDLLLPLFLHVALISPTLGQ